jgi:hypothetical protein
MFIASANTIALLLLRKLIAICSRCEDQVKLLILQIFESRGTRFVCVIAATVVLYVCYDVTHHQI